MLSASSPDASSPDPSSPNPASPNPASLDRASLDPEAAAACSLPFPSDVAIAVDLAERAGDELLSLWRKGFEVLDVSHKGRRDVVTEADRRSEALILAGIQAEFPGDPWLAEESGCSELAIDRAEEGAPLWIVDPLDGTTNFTHGHPLFSVAVARMQEGKVDLAVVVAPVLRETYVAWRGGGAYRNRVPIRISAECELRDALLATGFSYRRAELDQGGLVVWDHLLREAREIRRGGSACLDLAHTAAGIFQGYWEYYLAPHDVAAGSLLVEEAGGVVTDRTGGADFVWGRSVIAGNGRTHADLRRVLDEFGPPHPGQPQERENSK